MGRGAWDREIGTRRDSGHGILGPDFQSDG
jgi:hypothetical protein